MSGKDDHTNHAAESHQRASQAATKGTHGYDINAVFGRNAEAATHLMHGDAEGFKHLMNGLGDIQYAGNGSDIQSQQGNKHTMAELAGGSNSGSGSTSNGSSGGDYGGGGQSTGSPAQAIINNFGNRQTMADLVGSGPDKKKDSGWSLS